MIHSQTYFLCLVLITTQRKQMLTMPRPSNSRVLSSDLNNVGIDRRKRPQQKAWSPRKDQRTSYSSSISDPSTTSSGPYARDSSIANYEKLSIRTRDEYKDLDSDLSAIPPISIHMKLNEHERIAANPTQDDVFDRPRNDKSNICNINGHQQSSFTTLSSIFQSSMDYPSPEVLSFEYCVGF